MSQENAEIVKAAIDAFNRKGWGAAFQDAAPDFELDFSRALGPYRGVYGLDQAQRFVEDFTATFESVRFEADQLMMPVSTWSFLAPSITVAATG
jgi:hypothetical protein